MLNQKSIQRKSGRHPQLPTLHQMVPQNNVFLGNHGCHHNMMLLAPRTWSHRKHLCYPDCFRCRAGHSASDWWRLGHVTMALLQGRLGNAYQASPVSTVGGKFCSPQRPRKKEMPPTKEGNSDTGQTGWCLLNPIRSSVPYFPTAKLVFTKRYWSICHLHALCS